MSDIITITVPYRGEDKEFETQLELRGYTHRFKVMVGEVPVYFEPDEERNYRAILEMEDIGKTIKADLLEAIADTLSKELS